MPGWFDDFIGGIAAAAVIGLIAMGWRGGRAYWRTLWTLVAAIVGAAALVGAFQFGLSLEPDPVRTANVAELLRWLGLALVAVLISACAAVISAHGRTARQDRPERDRRDPPDRPR